MKLLALLLFVPPALLAVWGAWRGMQGLERRLTWWMAAHGIIGAAFTATALLKLRNLPLVYVYIAFNAALGFWTLAASEGRVGAAARPMAAVMPVVGLSALAIPNGPAIAQPIVILAFVLFAGLLLLGLSKAKSPILSDPRFWFAGGVLIGQGGGLLPWAFRVWGGPADGHTHPLWTNQNLAQLIGYFFYSGVFLCRR